MPTDLPNYPERAMVRRASDDDRAAIAACYDRVMRRSTLMVERSPVAWARRQFDDGRRFVVVFDTGVDVRVLHLPLQGAGRRQTPAACRHRARLRGR
jgi:hypothetical protein